ncbi:DMT family transporter [Cohnella sp. GCM10027633]|uniref:DMT family transporter n=1 Tax=unclassified Cohnella TaxID=2636738 RepID=UPI003627F626
MMTEHKHPPVPPLIPLFVGMIAISFAPILVRYSNADVSVQGMYRMLFTVLLMLPFGGKQFRTIGSISRKDWLLLVLAGIFLALHFFLWMASLDYTSIASSTIILALEPVFVMVGAYFLFKDRITKLAMLGLVVALVGTCFVSSGDLALSATAFKGDLLSFFGTLAVVVNMLIAKRILTRVSSYLYSIVVFAVSGILFTVYNVATGIPIAGYPQKEWIVFLLLAIVPTVFGHLIFNWLLQYMKTTTVSMSVLAEPVGASILGMFIFGELITSFQLAGGALVIFGLLLYLRSEQLASDKPISPSLSMREAS